MLSFFFLSCLTLNGQTKTGSSVLLQETILDSLGADRAALREKVKVWMGKTFRNASKVITSETEASIVGKYIVEVKAAMSTMVPFQHTIVIDMKDNKIRITITVDDSNGGSAAAEWFYPDNGKRTKMSERWLRELMDDASGVVKSLENTLRTKDEW